MDMQSKVDSLFDQISSKEIESDACGTFRQAYFFKHKRRKFVLKVDRTGCPNPDGTRSPRCSTIGESGFGTRNTIELWKGYSKDKDVAPLLAPIVLHGEINGLFWVVMPKLQMMTSMGGYVCNLYDKHIEPIKGLIPPEISEDLHYRNWGMTNRGKWLLLDY
jgi:hypothetical protein